MKVLYKDCQADYETNLKIYVSTTSPIVEELTWNNIFFDFKTYCFNKIKKMRSFLPNSVIDDWATNITMNALTAIKNKGEKDINNWPTNIGAYLSMFCLDINNANKYNPEKREVELTDHLYKKRDEGESFTIIDDKPIELDVVNFIIKEAIKMTVYNDGFNMVDVDRAVRLSIKYNGKIGKFSDKNIKIMNALGNNIKTILNGNIKGDKE